MILQIQNLAKNYPSFSLGPLSLSLPKGTIMGIIGENGAGKTTIIKSILNIIHSEQGTIEVFGMDHKQSEKLIKEQVGVVLDESHFHDFLTTAEIGSFMSSIYKNWNAEKFQSYLTQFQLPAKKTIKTFSRGMKMKLSIAVALAHEPKLLILDEPTSGLDPVVREEILGIFMDFIQDEEHSIFFSSHITSDIEKIADYVTLLHKGKILLSASKDDILTKYGIIKLPAKEFSLIDRASYIGYHQTQFGYELLVKDRLAWKRQRPGDIIEQPHLDDILIYFVKGA